MVTAWLRGCGVARLRGYIDRTFRRFLNTATWTFDNKTERIEVSSHTLVHGRLPIITHNVHDGTVQIDGN